MGRLGFGVARRRVPASPGVAPPVGFARNGSVNPALRAMLARVANGTGRGRVVFLGDSTTAGAGAGGSGSVQAQLANARPGRPSAAFAAELSGVGRPTLDNAVVGDNGCAPFGVALSSYDPRVSLGSPVWTVSSGREFAGGGLLVPASGGVLTFAPGGSVDTFEVVVYNNAAGALAFAIDGSTAVAITLAGSSGGGGATTTANRVAIAGNVGGFTRALVKAAAAGPRVLGVAHAGGGVPVVRSIRAYDGAVPAIDVLNHACNGGKAADRSAGGPKLWNNLDALAFDAPDLTIVNLGLNDVADGAGAAPYATHLRAIVAQAKLSGDVLLVFPHPAGGQFSTGAAAYRDAASAVAAEVGVAFLSLFDHFGGAFTPALQARMADGLVHGDAGFYAEVAGLYRRSVLAMAA